MNGTRLLRAGLMLTLAGVGAQACADRGVDPRTVPLSSEIAFCICVALVLAAILLECVLIAVLFRQTSKRALIASFLANAASFVIVGALWILIGFPCLSESLYSWLLFPSFCLSVAVEAPVVRRVCRLRYGTRFILCMVAIKAFTWWPQTVLFPNFDATSKRSSVSRAKLYMRSYATGIESYFVDNNAYPPAVPMKTYIKTSDADEPWASSLMIPGRLTTPIAYVTSYFPDSYGPVKDATFNYYADAKGWILVSPGPDRKYDVDSARDYNSSETQPSARLLQKCWDPTNGATSQGDIFRLTIRTSESSDTSSAEWSSRGAVVDMVSAVHEASTTDTVLSGTP